MFTGFDYAVLLVIGLSALRGLWRGLVSEVFSLIGWIAAFIIAWRYMGVIAPYMPANWPGKEATQWLLAFTAIVIGVMVMTSVFSALFRRLTEVTGLRSVDRSLGMLFGVVRGIMLVFVLVLLAEFTELPKQPFWRNALLLPYVEQGVRVLKPLLPNVHQRLSA